MSLCHGWGWQPPQTASHIHIRHMKSVWAHWYAVHMDMVAALHSYPHPTGLRFWGSGSLVVVESKWCHYVMFEADSHLKLLPSSILDIFKVFEHIDMHSISVVNGLTVSAVNSCIYTPRRHLPPCLHHCLCRSGTNPCHAVIVNFAGIVFLFVLASWPSLCWCCHPCCAGIVDVVALMLPLSLAWSTMSSTAEYMPAQWGQRHLQINCTMQAQQGQRGLHDKGNNASILRVTMPAWQGQWHQCNGANTPGRWGQQHQCNDCDNAHATWGQRGQRNKDNNTNATWVTMLLQYWQWCQCNKGKDAIVTMAKTPVHWWWWWRHCDEGDGTSLKMATTP